MPKRFYVTRQRVGGRLVTRRFMKQSGGALLPFDKIGAFGKDIFDKAYNYVDSHAGKEIAAVVDNLKDAGRNLLNSGRDDIFNEIDKRISKLTAKSGTGVRTFN